jgi:hypothetical protein
MQGGVSSRSMQRSCSIEQSSCWTGAANRSCTFEQITLGWSNSKFHSEQWYDQAMSKLSNIHWKKSWMYAHDLHQVSFWVLLALHDPMGTQLHGCTLVWLMNKLLSISSQQLVVTFCMLVSYRQKAWIYILKFFLYFRLVSYRQKAQIYILQ